MPRQVLATCSTAEDHVRERLCIRHVVLPSGAPRVTRDTPPSRWIGASSESCSREREGDTPSAPGTKVVRRTTPIGLGPNGSPGGRNTGYIQESGGPLLMCRISTSTS